MPCPLREGTTHGILVQFGVVAIATRQYYLVGFIETAQFESITMHKCELRIYACEENNLTKLN